LTQTLVKVNMTPRRFHFEFLKMPAYFPIDTVSAMITRNGGRPMIKVLLKAVLVIGGVLSPNWARVIKVNLKHLNAVVKAQGLPGLVKRLKVASVLLQQSSAGHVLKDITSLGPRISRAGDGLPLMILPVHRSMIRSGNPVIMRYYLTL
jgi:hypothetical protein